MQDALRTTPRTGTAFFFLVALGFTLSLQLPAALATLGLISGSEGYMALMGIGVFGPVLAAVLASRREAGREGIRALWGALKKPGLGLRWYAIALLLFAAIHLLGAALYKTLGGSGEIQWLYLPESSEHIAAMIMMPLVEEPGWRGFALPRLQSRFGPLKASLIIGLLWSVWHTMMFIIAGDTPTAFALACLNIMAGSLVFTWLYNRTKGSLLIAIVAHAGAHLNNPTHSLPGNITPFLVYTIALAVAALALILVDREAWRGSGVVSSNTEAP